jgi:hypothetical protein
MDINDLTIGQAKELAALFGGSNGSGGLDDFAIGRKVIVRTFSAGAWFGTLDRKAGREVILTQARRLYRFWCAKEITLSAVALYGVKHEDSKIVAPVPEEWLEAIEIIPCTEASIASLEAAPHAQAE